MNDNQALKPEFLALSYPYDASLIMRKIKSLKKDLASIENLNQIKIAILGGSSTSHIKNFLEVFLLKRKIKPEFWEGEYNQYFSDAVMGNEDFKNFNPQITIVYTSAINISTFPELSSTLNEIEELKISEIDKLKNVWKGIQSQTKSVILQNNFEYPLHRSMGNYEGVHSAGRVNYIRQVNDFLSKEISSNQGIYLNDLNYLSSLVGLEKWHDQDWWYLYKYSSSLESFPFIAESLAGIVQSILGLSKKNLILDLDNTAWGGVIGDDGVDGIQISPDTPTGEAFTAFQTYCQTLKKRGVVLSVCSKNDQINAEQGFMRQDSVLKLSDFASFKANWDRKDQNISTIAEELSLGLDSFVFIDDNPTERQIVRESLPQVGVPEVGNEVKDFATHIDRNYYFETIGLSADDSKRALMYEQNAQRRVQERSFTDYGDYLDSLSMIGEIAPFKKEYLERITQLINKTNQFNLTTLRMTIEEVTALASEPSAVSIYGRLKDKFGDNGLVSIAIGKLKDQELHVNLWLMSCRVLKKDFEKAMLDELIKHAKEKGAKSLIGFYDPTAKNRMVENHYRDLGFTHLRNNENKTYWILDIQNYEKKNKHIRIVNE